MNVAAAALASLEVTARFTRQTALSSWVVVQRQPLVVTLAQSIADELGLDVAVDIDAATIALRFVVPEVGDDRGRRQLERKRDGRLFRRFAQLGRGARHAVEHDAYP